MSKKVPPPAPQAKQEVPTQKKGIAFHMNLIALVVSFFFVLVLYKNVPTYQWLKDTLIKENLKLIKKYPRLTLDEKLQAKIGYDYAVIKMIKDSTPETAIVLLPPKDSCHKVRGLEKAQGLNGGGIASKFWCEYYLYPRKVVYSLDHDPDSAKVDYIAVIGGYGLERLGPEYQRTGYTVVSLKENGK